MINTLSLLQKKCRVAIQVFVFFVLSWVIDETQNWALFFGIIGVYSGFVLLVRYRKRDEEKKKK